MTHDILGCLAYVQWNCTGFGREQKEESAMPCRHNSGQPCALAAAPAHATRQARLCPLITQQPSTPDTPCVGRSSCSNQPTSEVSKVKSCICTPASPTASRQHGHQPTAARPAVISHILSPAMHATSCQPGVRPATEPSGVSPTVHASADSSARRPVQLVSAAVTDWGPRAQPVQPSAQPGHVCSVHSTSSCGKCTQP